MADHHIFYQDSKRNLSFPLFKKYEIEREESELKKQFIQYATCSMSDTLDELVEKHFAGKEWKDIRRYFFHQGNQKKKKRWKRKAFKDLEDKKLKTPKELFKLYKEYESTDPSSVERKLEPHKQAIINWAENQKTYLYEYPFFDEKTLNAKESALYDDLALDFLYYIRDEWDANMTDDKNHVKVFPFENQMPFANHTARKAMEYDGTWEHEGIEKPYKDIGTREGPIRFLVENNPIAAEMASAFNLEMAVYDLDQIDRDIIATVLEYRGKDFAINKTIEVKLGDLVKDVFHNQSTKSYYSMERRLLKLQLLKFALTTYEDERGTVMSNRGMLVDDRDLITNDWEEKEFMGLFDYVRFRQTQNNDIYLSIEVNQGIHRRFINNQTLRIYRDQLSMLDSRYHSMLLYMQKERIKAHRAGTNIAELTFTNFHSNIRFRFASKRKVRDEIIESLDELIKANVLVKSYTYGREQFVIVFEPINDQEVRDIIGEKHERIDLGKLLPSKDHQSFTDYTRLD